MIVDDEIDILFSLAEILEDLLPDAVVFPAGSAREALDFVCDRPVDLVITDHRMPGMSGEQLLKVLRESKSRPATILMTAYPNPGLAFRTESECQVDAVFAKPFDAALMAEKAREILDLRSKGIHITPEITPHQRQPGGPERSW